MPRTVKSKKPKGFFPSYYVRQDLRKDLQAAQAELKEHVVGRPVIDMPDIKPELGTALRREDILYMPGNLMVNYLLRKEVFRAVRQHRTRDAFRSKFIQVAPYSDSPIVVRRGILDIVQLDTEPSDTIRHHYGVVAQCRGAWLAGSRQSVNLPAETDHVRVGLLGEDVDITSPQLWLGSLAMPQSMKEFALEQLEDFVPTDLHAGPIDVIRRY